MKKLLLLLCLFSSSCFAVTAKSWILTEMDGTVILENNADEVRSIASITKLVTVSNAIHYDLQEKIFILSEDMKFGRMRSTPLKIGHEYTRQQLIDLALVPSDNVAALALGRTTEVIQPIPPSIHIIEASGLNPENVSTARELATMARSLVGTSVATTSIQTEVYVGGIMRRSTNPMLSKRGWNFSLSKTGFIDRAGGCIVTIFESGGRLVTAVILGSKDTRTRWQDLYELRSKIDSSSFEEPKFKKKRHFKRK